MAGYRFRGDGRKLAKLISSLEGVQKRAFYLKLNEKLAGEARDLAVDGFERSISPYGVRWRKPKRRNGQPLLDKGVLRSSIETTFNTVSFGLHTPIIYATPHQYGWPERNTPQRMFLPMGARGFGGRWRKALFTATSHLTTDAARAFAPVSMLAFGDGVVAMHPSVPARTLQEFIEVETAGCA